MSNMKYDEHLTHPRELYSQVLKHVLKACPQELRLNLRSHRLEQTGVLVGKRLNITLAYAEEFVMSGPLIT